jgi:hypothetical protein
MAERVDPQIGERFNPRNLIMRVLADLLDLDRGDLISGHFPSDRLLRRLDGSQLPPTIDQQLNRQAPDEETYLRQRAILELWGKAGTPIALPPALYAAFDVAPPKIAGKDESDDDDDGDDDPKRRIVDPRITAIRDWGRGEPLKEAVAASLRDRVYQALESYTDWDAAGLDRQAFSRRADGPFRAAGISFRRQQTQARAYPITLTLPLQNTTRALQQAAIA